MDKLNPLTYNNNNIHLGGPKEPNTPEGYTDSHVQQIHVDPLHKPDLECICSEDQLELLREITTATLSNHYPMLSKRQIKDLGACVLLDSFEKLLKDLSSNFRSLPVSIRPINAPSSLIVKPKPNTLKEIFDHFLIHLQQNIDGAYQRECLLPGTYPSTQEQVISDFFSNPSQCFIDQDLIETEARIMVKLDFQSFCHYFLPESYRQPLNAKTWDDVKAVLQSDFDAGDLMLLLRKYGEYIGVDNPLAIRYPELLSAKQLEDACNLAKAQIMNDIVFFKLSFLWELNTELEDEKLSLKIDYINSPQCLRDHSSKIKKIVDDNCKNDYLKSIKDLLWYFAKDKFLAMKIQKQALKNGINAVGDAVL